MNECWTTSPEKNKGWDSHAHLVTFSSTAKHVLCMFMFKDTLFDMYCWFINLNSWPTALKLKPEQGLPKRHIFSIRHTTVLVYFFFFFFALRNARQHSSTMPGVHFKHWHHHQNHKNAKNVALHRPWKRPSFTVQELEAGQWGALFNLSWERRRVQLKVFAVLLRIANVCKSTVSTDFRVTNTF